jgi:epoxyqueuosine reductase QueG
MRLDEIVRKLAGELGADFFGVADLSSAGDAILDQGGPVVAGYPRAISLGIALLHPIVDQLPNKDERAAASVYKHHAYDVVNNRLDFMASMIGSAIQKEGYRALPVSASGRVDDERICAIFSHKMAAHLAGLGWIGKSCLLITPEAGPIARWITVLTDAPLTVAGSPMKERCGSCRECVDACPAHAFTGAPFREDEPREARYDARKCQSYLQDMERRSGLAVCGQCLYVCPYGRRASVEHGSRGKISL